MNKKYLLTFLLLGTVGMIASLAFLVFEVPTPRQSEAATAGQTLSVNVTSTLTFSVATSTLALGTLTPGAAVTATTSATATTNAAGGWTLSIKRDDADTTLDLSTDAATNFPDYTDWTYSTPNSANAATVGATLSFRAMTTGTDPALYNSTWWGADDTTNALYAGLPDTSQQMTTIGTYVGSSQTVVYKFRADAPATQKTGSYDGAITLTALVTL